MASDFLGRGWPLRLPVPFDAIGDAATESDASRDAEPAPVVDRRLNLVDGERAIRQSIWMILSTSPGERPMRYDFGCGLHDVVFAQTGAGTQSRVAEAVRAALARWEPRIDVRRVSVRPSGADPAHLLIDIDYVIRASNSAANLVYPFYLES